MSSIEKDLQQRLAIIYYYIYQVISLNDLSKCLGLFLKKYIYCIQCITYLGGWVMTETGDQEGI